MSISRRCIPNSPRQSLSQAGLSLVELLIALTLSLVIVAALAELYVNLARSNQEMAKTNSQIENARFAMQFLQNDIVHAGYWGDFVPEFTDLTSIDIPADTPTVVPDPCLAFSTPWTAAQIDSLIGIPVQVHSATPGSCASVIIDRLANTDIVVVRHANTCLPGEANCEAEISPNLYLQVSNCELEIDADLFYVLSDTAADYTLHQRDCVGSAGTPPTITAGTIAPRSKFVQNIYYIREWANVAGDGIPTLVRSTFGLNSTGTAVVQGAAQELVQGIEAFRVEVGIDSLSDTDAAIDYTQSVIWADADDLNSPINRGDGIPDGNFVYCGAACTVAQLTDVVALKIWILARTDEETAGYTDTKTYLGGSNPVVTYDPVDDGFKRHVFSNTIRINNAAGRRETP
jgi:type IV pilus assembly protein PilW